MIAYVLIIGNLMQQTNCDSSDSNKAIRLRTKGLFKKIKID